MCLKGKQTADFKPGNYCCKKCFATAKEQRPLCKAKKIR